MDRSKWEYCPFEDCIEKSKKTKQLMTSDYQNEGAYPIISQEASLISGYTDDHDYVNHFNRPVVIFGDHTRALKYVDFDFAVGADGVKILVPHAKLDAKFLLGFLTWYKIPNLGYSRHYKLLKEISVPVPPIEDQQRIVAELDCLNEMIAVKQEQLKEFDKLAQSIFYDMFGDLSINNKGWQKKPFTEIAVAKTGITYKPDNVKDSGIIVLRSSNVQEDALAFEDVVRIDLPISEKYYVQNGDILMCSRNGSARLVGKTARIMNVNEIMTWGAFMTIIRSQYNDFLFHYFKTDTFRDSLASSKTTTVHQITIGMLNALNIPLPTLTLQQQFAEKISAIEAQKKLVKQSIAETQHLLDYTMDKYFG